ncbi:MAG: S9 family peptidase, partial [Acidobacteria bacterium]|nr:S9 family peptidase [Acidobacteriota bacterium]
DGKTTDITPMPFNARTRVHEYGGGSYAVINGTVYFSNFTDQRLYRQDADSRPRAITPETDLRYADGVIDKVRNRMICIREDHTVAGQEAITMIVGIDLDGEIDQTVLVSGNDFYSSPRLSPDGSHLAWLAWNHPNMPWDGSELWVAEVMKDGSLANKTLVAGGAEESIFQPEWSPDGVLHFISDRTGWWNLYRLREGKIGALCEMKAEFGLPQWVFGMSTYAFESANQIVCAYIEQGFSRLAILDTSTGKLETIESPYMRIEGIRVKSGSALFIAGSPAESTSIVSFDLTTRNFENVRRSSDLNIETDYISIPQSIEFLPKMG